MSLSPMAPLKPLAGSSAPLYVRVADSVCDALASGRIAPGDQLPPQTSLARQLGISALTVGKGYELLRMRGIVAARRGSGTYVNPDALRYAQHAGKRRYNTLRVITGETSLAKGRRETIFIATDILDGIRDALGQRDTHFDFLESCTPADLAGINNDDAVLLFCPREVDAALVDDLAQRGIPVLNIYNTPNLPPVPHVNYDQQQAAQLPCRYLIDCGYKRIGFIGVQSRTHEPTAPKFLAFMTTLADAGLDVSARYVRDAPVDPGAAYAAARSIIDAGDVPEAFFIDTDYKAMEVTRALGDAGLRVPDDVGIAAYDDIPEAAQFSPALTTVRWPRRELGRRAGAMLQEWPTDGSVPDSVTLTSQLIVRDSTRSVL